MLNVRKNQHRWKSWIEDDLARCVLEQAAETLKWAWGIDKNYPKSYPVNTSHVFEQIAEQLRHEPGEHKPFKLPPPPPPPQSLFDLVDDKMISAVYEDQNDGSYKDALRRAADFGGGASWRKILRAVDAAYAIGHYGDEAAPKPRVHFLHRNLLALLESPIVGEKLQDLRLEGIQDFFDDLCPCGTEHTAEAIRKLRKRRAGRRVNAAVDRNSARRNQS